ncbi:helix-turn-helix domain-containing protein [Pelagibius sp.]|uniref:helix-turn-helix domain-containing protein n=1 Tax=Pelagibius sp. TaxID=1931238 RepID=UPI003B50AD8B
MIDMSRDQLASAAGIAPRTLADFESGARKPLKNNLLAIQAALEAAGIVFIEANGGGVGVRLKD